MRRGLLATETELAGIGQRLGVKPYDHIYEILRKRCALILESQPVTEAMWQSAWEQGRWGAATNAVATMQGRIFDLAVSHHIDRNVAYRDRAVEELMSLAGFSTWVDPSHAGQDADLCTGEACATAAVALDLLAEEMSDADRDRCRQAILDKGVAPYLRAVEAGAFWWSAYHNWNAVINAGVGLAGLLLSDEAPDAADAAAGARKGLDNFFHALGRQGGWDEGLGYWGYAMRYVVLFGEALVRTADDHHLVLQRGMEATGLFPIYFTPGGVAASFGDRPVAPIWGALYLLAKWYHQREVAWWLDRYAFRQDVVTSGVSDAGLALLFRPKEFRASPKPRLHPVKAFDEIGWAALADRWPEPTFYAALKTGDLSAHHAQLDMNAVQVVCDGELLLAEPGSPDFSKEYLSPEGRYRFYEVQSASHNTLTIGDRGHRLDAAGSIVEAKAGANYRWIAGEAGGALGEDVVFVRHVVMICADGDRMLVVLDEIRNVMGEKIEATWHTPGRLVLDDTHLAGTLTGAKASLHFAFAGQYPFVVDLGARPLGSGRTDHVLSVATSAPDDTVLASVFADRPPGAVTLKVLSNGKIDLSAGLHRLTFEPGRGMRRLATVKTVGD